MTENLTYEQRVENLTRGVACILRDNPVRGSHIVCGVLSWDGANNEPEWLAACERRLAALHEQNAAAYA
jgi:hypothetical protein